jgi:bifunctional non-homologous end joining protein LigD
VLDGEIACIDESGRSIFRDLRFRKAECVFVAFDLLLLNGKELRTLPLIGRKALLNRQLRRKHARMLYLDHVEGDGRLLFDRLIRSSQWIWRALSARERVRHTR